MPQRNSTDNRENPTILRKSPRLLQQNQHDPKYPNTPNPIPKQNLVPHLDHTPLRSISDEVPLNKYKKLKRGQLSEKAKETNVLRRSSIRMSSGPSLSTRLSGGAEDFPCVRRSSRFSHKGNVEKIGCAEEFNCVRRSPRFSHNGNVESIDLRKISRRVDLSGKSLNVTEKRLTRSCNNGVLGGTRKGCDGFTKTILNEYSSAESISEEK
ncbi:hypothetical protein ACH5RR_011606 [Cinchona calisaya]|uniref:Uncharacterized protein n=1 Tax=Cinchona calisaya TaxID=153742 RepID=A0ABD3A8Z8_9GENT